MVVDNNVVKNKLHSLIDQMINEYLESEEQAERSEFRTSISISLSRLPDEEKQTLNEDGSVSYIDLNKRYKIALTERFQHGDLNDEDEKVYEEKDRLLCIAYAWDIMNLLK